MLLAKPVLLATNSLGMRLPLAENALLQAACLVPALLSSSRACAELSAIAGGDSILFTDIAQASRPPSLVAPTHALAARRYRNTCRWPASKACTDICICQTMSGDVGLCSLTSAWWCHS